MYRYALPMMLVIAIAAVLLLTASPRMAQAKGCSATVKCMCRCHTYGIKYDYNMGTRDVDGSCKSFFGKCTGPCTPSSDKLKHAKTLCEESHMGKCKDKCKEKGAVLQSKMWVQDEKGKTYNK